MDSKTGGSETRVVNRGKRAAHIAAMVMAAGLAAPALAQDRSWNTTGGQWSAPGNWTPLGAPLLTSTAFIGNTGVAENAIVQLNQNAVIAGLQLSDGMRLHMNGFWLNVTGTTVVSGLNILPPDFAHAYTTLQISDVVGTAFVTNNLTLNDCGRAHLADGAEIVVNDLLSIADGSGFTGNGTVTLNGSGTTLMNNGQIRDYSDGGIEFAQSDATGRYDLDGTTGDGWLLMIGEGSFLGFSGLGLTDPFSGSVSIAGGSRLHVSLVEGWSADQQSAIHLGNSDPAT